MRYQRFFLVTTLCGVLLAFGCSDDDGPADPGGGGGGGGGTGTGGELAAALSVIDQEYFAGHAATYRSLGYLGPYIEGLIGLKDRSEPAGPHAAKAACFPNLVAGTTYAFDGSAYAATDRPGAGPEAVRFLLYAVDEMGILDPQTETGHIELTCSDVAGLNLTCQVVLSENPTRPVIYFSLTGDSGYYDLSGGITSATGGSDLELYAQDTDWTSERSFTVTIGVPDFSVSYGMRDYLDAGSPAAVDSTYVGATAWKWDLEPPQTIVLEVMVQLMLEPSRDIRDGLLIYSGASGNSYLIGCFAGSLHAPLIQPIPSGQEGECNPGDLETQTIGQLDAAAYGAAFVRLTEIFEMIRGIHRTSLRVGGA